MKFSIGDKILLKRTGEEGHVVAFMGKDMVEIDLGGTIFPVYIEDIDHPYLKWFTEKSPAKKKATFPQQLPVEKLPASVKRMAKGVYLSFIPEFITEDMEEVVSHVRIFLLNELPFNIKFVYDARFAEGSLFRHEGGLQSFGNMYLHSIPYADMNDQPRFNWSVYGPENTEADGILRIKPAKLFDHVTAIQQGNDSSFSYLLAAELQEKKKPEPMFVPPVIQHKVTTAGGIHVPEPPRYEIDLHIEKLRNNPRGLSNAEIVKIQLDTLEHYLQLAIVHRQDRLIVIHGLGKGRLRDEVHNILKANAAVARYKKRMEWSLRFRCHRGHIPLLERLTD
jgi:hypothetical protein